MQKKCICIILSFILSFLIVVPVQATTISGVKQEQQTTQNSLDAVSDQISEIEGKNQLTASQIEEKNTQLVDILTSIDICQEEINTKEEEVQQAKADLEAAQAQEVSQYEAMKTRMKFMYERGDTAYLELFVESDGFSDMINKAGYVEKLYEYDRDRLVEYQTTRESIETLKVTLEQEEAELLAATYELQQEQVALESTIEELKSYVADFDSQLASAKKQASAYKEQLKQQTAKIKKLEDEQRQKQETAQASTNTGKGNGSKTASSESVTVSSAGSAQGRELAGYACQFVGNPYVFGGTSLTNGTDCSGFTQAVYSHFGYSIPRDSTSQRSCGVAVSYEEAQPGDLICYAGHVALYLGDGRIVHASTTSTGIKYGYATYRTILSVRRVL